MSARGVIAGLAALSSRPAQAQEGAFAAYEQLPGVAMSLGLVVALIVVAAWLLRRSPLGAFARANGPLKVVATLPLGPKERLILVESEGTRLLLGVAPSGIRGYSPGKSKHSKVALPRLARQRLSSPVNVSSRQCWKSACSPEAPRAVSRV